MKFETNKTYTGKFITDSNATYSFKIIKRTDKRLTIIDAITKELKQIGIKLDSDGNEIAYPYGKYSMAPMIRSTRFI